MEREKGFYWVRYFTVAVVGEYVGDGEWLLHGNSDPINEKEGSIKEIGEKLKPKFKSDLVNG